MNTKVPILFIVFNRPDKTAVVLKEIAKYQPSVIYIASDGPRNNVHEDIEKCESVRSLLRDGIDWQCTIHQLYRDVNAGCRVAVSKAISWFFSCEPYGVILEDDCIPSQSFFDFASDMLVLHEHNTRIHSISGCNFGYRSSSTTSLGYTNYMNMWGWATWRRVAIEIDYELKEWKSFSQLRRSYFLFKNLASFGRNWDPGWIAVWKNKFNLVAEHNYNTWDYQWFYRQFKTRTLSIFPAVNLTRNIGYGLDATHTKTETNDFLLGLLHRPYAMPQGYKTDKFFEEQFVKKTWVTYVRKPLLQQLFTILVLRPLKKLGTMLYFIFFVQHTSVSYQNFRQIGIYEYKRLRATGKL